MLSIQLLGQARARCGAGQEVLELERKTAACLALIAVEGRQGRGRLASLLWPSAPEEASRGNLRQLVRRLRVAAGEDVLTSTDPLELNPAVSLDVRQLSLDASAGNWARVAAYGGELLAGMSFDDCPELSDWLDLTRQRLDFTLAHALSVEAHRLAAERGPEAIPLVLRWLELDPLSEDAYRCLMRLHHLNGDRGAALRVFEKCRSVLQRQLEIEPSEPTAVLAREIRGTSRVTPASGMRRVGTIPLSVLRPPALAGREAQWRKLACGLADGKLVFVMGPAGIGKTRLVQDFAAQERNYRVRYIACRPGDQRLPYAYFARTWRHDLAMFPERLSVIPDWARRELARILPELGPAPPPLESADGRLRFFEANLEMAKANDAEIIVVSDDVHHLDVASHELGIFLGMYFIGKGSPLRSVSTFRPDELDAEARGHLDATVDSGQAVAIELSPLGVDELRAMLASVALGDLSRHAERLHAFTGGIPFYVVETLKSLHEDPEPGSLPEALTPTDRVRLTIERRLGRLKPNALLLLRAAAVLDEPLSFELALSLLGRVEALSAASVELEQALLLRGGVVAHELLRSVILGTMPGPTGAELHGKVARALAAAGAHPARIAAHFIAAGDDRSAAMCLDQAAALAHGMFRSREAEQFRAHAGALEGTARDSAEPPSSS